MNINTYSAMFVVFYMHEPRRNGLLPATTIPDHTEKTRAPFPRRRQIMTNADSMCYLRRNFEAARAAVIPKCHRYDRSGARRSLMIGGGRDGCTGNERSAKGQRTGLIW